MTDENKESSVSDDTVKKSATSSKKLKAESSKNTDKLKEKKNIINKLKAMGVMSGKNSDAKENENTEHESVFKIVTAVVVATLVVGSFVWALNKEAASERVITNAGVIQPSNNEAYNLNNNTNNNTDYNYDNQQQRAQYQKWVQQQQQAFEQERAQYQKWAQQQQKIQAQHRAQQQKWAQQQQQALQNYRVEQQKWAQQQEDQQQKLAQQQQDQPQKWAQQHQVQQPQTYYGYPQYGSNGTSAPTYYNYQPGYQQPGRYYRR